MKQAVGGDVANFLVNWEDWLPGQILSCVKQVVGGDVANFLGELGRLASWSNSCLLEPQFCSQ